jgi:rod shape-determining protein MreB and related proteins
MTRLEKILRQWRGSPSSGKHSATISLDIGSHTTKVLAGQRIVIHPTCFIQHQPTHAVLAVGKSAISMLGKLPKDARAVFPIRSGKVIDSHDLQIYLDAILKDYVSRNLISFLYPQELRVAVTFPDQVPQLEVWRKTLRKWGQRITVVAIADALWTQVKTNRVFTLEGCVIDVGAMTTKLFLYTGEQKVLSKVAEFGGDTVTDEMLQALRQEYHLEVGWVTAEQLKVKVLQYSHSSQKHTVQGKDLVSGLPVTKVIDDSAFDPSKKALLVHIVQAFTQLCQAATPELVAKIYESGIYLTGGGSVVPGLAKVLQTELKLPIHQATTSQEDLVRGLAIYR